MRYIPLQRTLLHSTHYPRSAWVRSPYTVAVRHRCPVPQIRVGEELDALLGVIASGDSPALELLLREGAPATEPHAAAAAARAGRLPVLRRLLAAAAAAGGGQQGQEGGLLQPLGAGQADARGGARVAAALRAHALKAAAAAGQMEIVKWIVGEAEGQGCGAGAGAAGAGSGGKGGVAAAAAGGAGPEGASGSGEMAGRIWPAEEGGGGGSGAGGDGGGGGEGEDGVGSGSLLSAEVFAAAVESGSAELLGWLLERGCPTGVSAAWCGLHVQGYKPKAVITC